MSSHLPAFLRRARLLRQAREALDSGLPERALSLLEDEALADSREADRLRDRVVEAMCRLGLQRAGRGPVAAASPVPADSMSRVPSESLEPTAAHEASLRHATLDLLARMRGARSGDDDGLGEAGERGDADGEGAGAGLGEIPAGEAELPAETPVRFHLAVDDGGEFLAVSGRSLVLGHSRSACADLPFLADLDARHARLFWIESFHGGPRWNVEPVGSAFVAVNGRRVHGASVSLCDGDEVRFSPNMAFRFRLPEFASSSALLELMKGLECEGAVHVLLFGPGPAGRVRIGAARNRHILVPDLDREVVLTLLSEGLSVHCTGGVRVSGDSAPATDERVLPCPPEQRVDLFVSARAKGGPPFTVSIYGLDPPEGGPGVKDGGGAP